MIQAAILSAMMQLASPGVSPNSRVMIDIPALAGACDEACEDHHVAHYGDAPKFDVVALGGRIRWPGWSRQETRGEALSRWAIIARAIETAAREETRWIGKRAVLRAVLVALARAESAYWLAVHEGRLRGTAGEWGLWQCHPDVPGCDASVVGTDLEATTRGAKLAARHLASSYRLVIHDCPTSDPADHFRALLGRVFSAYGTGAGCARALPDADKRAGWALTALAALAARVLPEAAEVLR